MLKLYRLIVDHLTKALGILGAGFASVMAVDPDPIRQAAAQYLNSGWQHKIYIGLFVLVILRGWYTGRKAKQ